MNQSVAAGARKCGRMENRSWNHSTTKGPGKAKPKKTLPGFGQGLRDAILAASQALRFPIHIYEAVFWGLSHRSWGFAAATFLHCPSTSVAKGKHEQDEGLCWGRSETAVWGRERTWWSRESRWIETAQHIGERCPLSSFLK